MEDRIDGQGNGILLTIYLDDIAEQGVTFVVNGEQIAVGLVLLGCNSEWNIISPARQAKGSLIGVFGDIEAGLASIGVDSTLTYLVSRIHSVEKFGMYSRNHHSMI